ncbi:unnamed protein product, partial [Gulo gulo]
EAAPSPALPLPTGRRSPGFSVPGPTSGPSWLPCSRYPREEGLARYFWLGGVRFCSRRKVKVLGMRETRRTYSWASLDRGRTPQQPQPLCFGIILQPSPAKPNPERDQPRPGELFLREAGPTPQ